MDMSFQALWSSMNWSAKTVVIVLLIMSIYSIWVMVERYITFQQAKNQSLKLLGALSNVLTRGDYQQAIDITKKYKQSHLAKVISAGLLEFEAARRDKRTSGGGIASVSAGIAEALVTTAFGLFVAIPAVWAYNYFQNRIDRFTVEMSNSGSEMAIYFLKEAGNAQQKSSVA